MLLAADNILYFQKLILNFYAHHGRTFTWRYVDDPYKVFISEVMLQQTQTSRVIYKYEEFLEKFPHFHSLANASLHDVLAVWSGLGYNRRGKFLHQAAQIIVTDYYGKLPQEQVLLEALPGIGPATASSILAFAFNKPTLFIETNIRSVFIHHFFAQQDKVNDTQIHKLVEQTLDYSNPRRWYYALMDYGVMLKQSGVNPSRKSTHYIKQSKFQGSNRQVRGAILKLLTQQKQVDYGVLHKLEFEEGRINQALQQLVNEQLIVIENEMIKIK